MFNKDDIMPGYVLKFKDEYDFTYFALVANCDFDDGEITKCYSSKDRWGESKRS